MNRLLYNVLLIKLLLCTSIFISCSSAGSDPAIYDVSVNATPAEGGTVSPSDSSYEEGTSITLTATPNEEYLFSKWSGDIDTTRNPLTLTVNQNYNIVAQFQLKSYELTINTEGDGSVSEQIVQQKTEYNHGTVVELTANPSTGWKFVEWQGDVTGTNNPEQITMDGPKTVTAVFEKKSYELTVNTTGEGAVSEEVVTAKAYEFGTVVELTASPSTGWKFVEWLGDLRGTQNPEQITIDTAKTVTAVFEKKTYAVNVSTTGEGTVSKSPDQTAYEYNSIVDLTATPSTGWNFVEWQGDVTGSNNPEQITIDGPKTVTAVFSKNSYPVNITIDGEGSVTKNPDQNTYEFEEIVDLTANPSTGWSFVEWSGDISRTENPTQVVVDTSKNITAKFEPTNTNVTVSIDWTNLGDVPQEVFSGSQSNGNNTSGSGKTVTHFGVRIEHLDSDKALSNSVENDGVNSTAIVSFNDIEIADSAAIYAIAVNTTHAVKLGVIKKAILDTALNYQFTHSDFSWFAPSWGTGPDFAESGWDTARVSKSVQRADIEFDVVNPYDGADRTHDFIMRLNGVGGFENYKGNNIREYRTVVEHPNPGSVDTVRSPYEWHPYIDETKFSLPNTRYIVDLRSSFIVIFE